MYFIQEIQTTGGQSALLPVISKETEIEAESEWHIKMGYAAISSVEIHTVIMYDEHGNFKKQGFYEHIQEPQITEE